MKSFIQSTFFAALVALISHLPLSSTAVNIGSISMELIPPAHHKSPLYEPSLSPSQLLHNAITTSDLPQPSITSFGWYYLLSFALGTPPRPLLGTIDLATDFTWAQCRPCTDGGGPHCQGSPYFDPSNSSTYRTHHCDKTANCQPISSGSATCSGKRRCRYSVNYDDGSSSTGVLSSDTLTLAGTTIPNFTAYFGCGSYNKGLYSVVGLGEGSASLVGQLHQNRFSYSLVPPTCANRVGNLTLGGPGVSGVTLHLANGNKKGAYYVTLQGISVEETKIPIQGGVPMLVNPRTMLMRLPLPVFKHLKNAIRSAVHLMIVRDPTGIFNLCFAGSQEDYSNLSVNISLNFDGGDVRMRTINMFVHLNDSVCLAALPAVNGSEAAVYGSFAQINFLVGVDLTPGKRAVSVQQLENQTC